MIDHKELEPTCKKLVDLHVIYNLSWYLPIVIASIPSRHHYNHESCAIDLKDSDFGNLWEKVSYPDEDTGEVETELTYREPLELWVVSTYLGRELLKRGECVLDTPYDQCWWLRTTSGQHISCDGVIEKIAEDYLTQMNEHREMYRQSLTQQENSDA